MANNMNNNIIFNRSMDVQNQEFPMKTLNGLYQTDALKSILHIYLLIHSLFFGNKLNFSLPKYTT